MMEPLRYNISNWHQLKDVLSNKSRKLHIVVSDFMQNDNINATRITVKHEDYGVMFCCTINASGSLVQENTEGVVYELTPSIILAELEKFGFLVTFEPKKHLSNSQLDYLETLQTLHYDKLRVLNVWHQENGIKVFKWYVVAFTIKTNSQWLNNGYSPSDYEYTESLRNGSAINISEISKDKKWDWSWLDYVANISDILEDNGR